MTSKTSAESGGRTAQTKPASGILVESAKQLKDSFETIHARMRRLPSDLGNVIDDFCHVIVDCLDRTSTSITVLKSLVARDPFAAESVCCGKAARLGHFQLAETYFWTSLCLIGFECGEIVGGWSVVGSVLEMMLHPINSLILVVFVLPFFVHTWLRKSPTSDDTRRMWTFEFAFLTGLLLSYGYSQPMTMRTPPLFLLPFTLGWMCCLNVYYNRTASTRILFLVFCFFTPYLVYVAYTYMTIIVGATSVWWIVVVCTTAIVDLQLKIGRLARRWSTESLEQWSSTVIFIIAHTLFRLLALIYASLGQVLLLRTDEA